MTTNIIYRDDDVNVHTCPHLFKKLHSYFIREQQVHTAAVLMKDLWENHALFWYLATAPFLEIGLHGWEHKDYSILSYAECYDDIEKSLVYWHENSVRMINTCKPIEIFFAPWNRESNEIRSACKDLGLKFCNVRKGVWEDKKILSFHHWYITMADKYEHLFGTSG